MPFKCKDTCRNYKDVKHLHHSYNSGLITFCSVCQVLFLVKDTNNYWCTCCHSRTRHAAKTKRLPVEHVRY